MKAFLARLAGWGQFGINAIDASLQSNGVPKSPHDWLRIFGSAALAIAVHFASGTDGSK